MSGVVGIGRGFYTQSYGARHIFLNYLQKYSFKWKIEKNEIYLPCHFLSKSDFHFQQNFQVYSLMGNYKGNKFYSLQFFIWSYIFDMPRSMRLRINTPVNLTRDVVGRYVLGTIYYSCTRHWKIEKCSDSFFVNPT